MTAIKQVKFLIPAVFYILIGEIRRRAANLNGRCSGNTEEAERQELTALEWRPGGWEDCRTPEDQHSRQRPHEA